MRYRWTMKELADLSDPEIIARILSERMSGLNYYAPLYRRLMKIRDRLDKQIAKRQTKR